MIRLANAYFTLDEIYLVSNGFTWEGISLQCLPVIKLNSCDPIEEIGRKIIAFLLHDPSRRVNIKRDTIDIVKNYLQPKARKYAKLVSIAQEGQDQFTFSPTKRDRNGGYEGLEEVILQASDPALIGQALLDAFTKCQ